MRKFTPFIVTMLVFFGGATLFASPAAEEEAGGDTGIVATTSWAAAFVYATGAEEVAVLAPYQLRHPPEYELKPSDIRLVGEADIVIYAGYERMVSKIRDATGNEGPELLQIVTQYDIDTIRESVMSIASILDTEEIAGEKIEQINSFYADWKNELEESGLAGARVVCHAFQRPLVQELGMEVVGVFGPAPLETREIDELTRLAPALIIDNYHNDVGKPLRETLQNVPTAVFVNFPGVENTVTLLDVLKENRNRLRNMLPKVDSAK